MSLAPPSDRLADPEEPALAEATAERRRRRAIAAGAIAAYLLLSVTANWTVWRNGLAGSIPTSGGNDVVESVWFLAQTPWAILRGTNPLFNHWLNFPHGINLMDNTTMPLLGLLGSPITVLAGPVATFNVMVDLALASTATAGFFMARRFVRWWPAAFVGGLLYGFSPFAVAVGHGHLMLLFGPVPALVVIVLDRTLRTRETSFVAGGALLGLAGVAQFFISAEVFASLVVMLTATAAILGVRVLHRKLEVDWAALIKGLVASAAVVVVGIGYGGWMALAGPGHISGPAQSRVSLAGLSTDPLGWVVPTLNQHFTYGLASVGDPLVAQRNAHWHVLINNASENGSYIGVPLLLTLLVGTVVLWRRRPVVPILAAVGAVAQLLSLGSRLHVDGRLTAVRLPFDVLSRLPLFDSSVAARYEMFFWLCAAPLLAVIIDETHAAVRRAVARRSVPRIGPALPPASATLLAVVTLLPLVPAWPYRSAPWQPPAWFGGGSEQLAVGTGVLVYPPASPQDAEAMGWQAQAGLRFAMPGGYAVFRSKKGPGTFFPPIPLVAAALRGCRAGQHPAVPASRIRSDLADLGITYVVIPVMARHADCAEALIRPALGDGRFDGGVLVFGPLRPTSAVRSHGAAAPRSALTGRAGTRALAAGRSWSPGRHLVTGNPQLRFR